MKWRPDAPRPVLYVIDMPSARIIPAARDEEDGVPSTQSKLGNKFPLSRSELSILLAIFIVFSISLLSIYWTLPVLDSEVLRFPQTLTELRRLKDLLATYTKDYTAQVLLGYVATYIFMQTFMIPGTIFFSLLAGALFGVYRGIILVVFSATAGASTCYFLSTLFARPLICWLWPERLSYFRGKVAQRREKLFNYMLFLRITPTLPNTFINLASPIVDVPFHIFFWATLLGLIPASIVTVRAGLTLGDLESVGDLYNMKTVALLFAIGLLVIVPTVLNHQSKEEAL